MARQTSYKAAPRNLPEPISLIGIYSTSANIAYPKFSQEFDEYKQGIFPKFIQTSQTQSAMDWRAMGPHRKVKLHIEKEIKQCKLRARCLDAWLMPDVTIQYSESDIQPRMHASGRPVSTFTLHTWGQDDPLALIQHDLITQITTARLNDAWIPLMECIDKVADRLQYAATETQNVRIENQRVWWAANGKHFPFLKLPAELRNEIYRAAFGQAIRVPSKNEVKSRRKMNWGQEEWTKHNFALFLTNRQINNEVRHIVYDKTQYVFKEPQTLTDLSIPSGQLRVIKHLRIEFETTDIFFDMFGLKARGHIIHQEQKQHASFTLQSMVNLESVEIVLPEPYTCRDQDGNKYVACQYLLAQWILTGAWKYVRGHNVTVKGYVKDSQKQDFEKSCAMERERFLEYRKLRIAAGKVGGSAVEYAAEYDSDDEGGIGVDGKARERLPIRDWDESELPVYLHEPKCRCAVPCSDKILD